MQISDLVDFTALDPVLTETAMLLGEQAANSLDQIVRDVIVAGSTVQYANNRAGRTTVATGDIMTSTEVRRAVRTLKRNNAKPFDDGCYVALTHPDTIYDIQGDVTWQNAQLYAGSTSLFTGEVGKFWGVRFVESTNGKKFTAGGAGSIDVYGALVVAPNYYGIVDLAGEGAVKNIVKPLGSAGTSDPLNQIATSGWKAIFTSVRLNENCCVRLEHAVSA